MNTLKVKNAKKIAILRANAIGDFVVTLPAIQSIEAAYPDTELVLLGKPWHKEFLTSKRTPIDRVIVIPVTKGIRQEAGLTEDKQEVEAFLEEMRKEQFDIVINFHGKGITSNPFIKGMKPRLTVGLSCPEGEPIDRSLDFYYYESEVVRYLEVASLIGAGPVTLEPELSLAQQDIEEAENIISVFSVQPFVVIHACGTDKRRMWQVEKFSELGDYIASRGYTVFFTGSDGDHKEVNTIISGMSYPAVNLCGKLSLGGTTALFSKSKVTIGIDTGPLHLARAAGAATIGLYWAPNVINWGPLTRAKHRPVISWNLNCPGCGIIPNNPYPFEPITESCSHNFSFIKDITVYDVVEQLKYFIRN